MVELTVNTSGARSMAHIPNKRENPLTPNAPNELRKMGGLLWALEERENNNIQLKESTKYRYEINSNHIQSVGCKF